MNILVTGHKGFIGSHVLERLKETRYAAHGLDKKDGFDLSQLDDLLEYHDCYDLDAIIHLAANCSTAKSLKDPASDFRDNAIATFNICELARTKGAKLIFTSSCKVKPNKMGIRAPYGLSKYVGELYIKEYAGCYGLDYIINRPGTVYGIGQEGSSESGWVSWFLKAKRENKKITIYGDGKQVRDILHVDDYVNLVMDQLENFKKYQGQTYDVGGGEKTAVNLIEMLRFIKYDNYEYGSERKGDVKRFVSDNSKVSAINGWKPKVNWKTGIKNLLKE